MKKITLFLIFTTLFSCKRDDNLSMVKKAKIGNLEVTGLEIQNKLWISNTNFLVDLTQKKIELYTEDQVSHFIKWKKNGNDMFYSHTYDWPKKPWAVKIDDGTILYSEKAINFFKTNLPKDWRLPDEKDLKELDNFLKKNLKDSASVKQKLGLNVGHCFEQHEIMEQCGISLRCSSINGEYPIWLNDNQIFWFKDGYPVFDKNNYIYSKHLKVYAAQILLVKDIEYTRLTAISQ